jgi:arsenate reductase
MQITIYHYPKCSTSASALSFLKANRINPQIVLYCETGITKSEILHLMKLLNVVEFKGMVKRNGITYRNLGLAHKNLSNEEWLETIIQNPKLLQRPIIVNGNLAIVGKNIDIIKLFLKL